MPKAATALKHARRIRSPQVWQAHGSVASNARLILPAMAREYFAAGREVVEAKVDAEDLHPFRLATKQFRYTLEIFRDVYGASLDRKLSLLKPIQDALGDINDCVATRRELAEGQRFRDYLSRRADKKKRQFFHSWKNQFDAHGQEAAWVRYLSRVARLR
jgi:CHAD domain-containing protein